MGTSMTKKHFELIAGSIARSRQASSIIKDTAKGRAERDAKMAALKLVAIDLAASLAHTNPNFDKERFLRAAGIERVGA